MHKNITGVMTIIALFIGVSAVPLVDGTIIQINCSNEERNRWDVNYDSSWDTAGNAYATLICGAYPSVNDARSPDFEIIDLSNLINSPITGSVRMYRRPHGVCSMFVLDEGCIPGYPSYNDIDEVHTYKECISYPNVKYGVNNREASVSFDDEIRKTSSLLNLGIIYYVGGSGQNNYTSIQAAIDAASDGDTVFVYDDSSPYYEHVIVNKSINLIGEDKDSTVIDGSNLKDFFDTVSVTGDHVSIDGFIVKNNFGDYYQAAIKIVGDHVTVSNCKIYNNEWIGIYLFGSSYCQLSDCELHNNLMAIQLYDSNDNEIRDCFCYENGEAVTLFESSHNNQIVNCSCYGNGYGGIHVQRSSGNQIIGCLCQDGYKGISLAYAPNTRIRGNVLYNNYENFGIGSSYLSDFYCDIDTSNTINGKPIRYIIEQNDLVFDETMEIGFLGLVSCRNIQVNNLDLTNNFQGIVCAGVSDCSFENCNFCNNRGHGMFFVSSSNNRIKNCVCKDSFFSGIYLCNSCNSNTFSDNTFSNDQVCGIWLEDSTSSFISGHSISNCGRGILLDKSAGSVLRDNEMTSCGLLIDGTGLSDYINDVDTSNTVNGKPIYYYIDENGITIPQDAGEVILINCNYCTVSNLDLNDGTIGLELAYSSYNTISDNVLNNNNVVAIDLDGSSNNNNTIKGNVIRDNGYGIDVDSSCHNIIQDNIIHNNGVELSLDFSDSNTVTENNIQNSVYGIYVCNSNSNTLSDNAIQDSDFSGIYLLYSKNNVLKDNEMINCGLIVYGISLPEYVNDVDTSNIVNGKPIYYYIDKSEMTVPQDAGEVILINCNYCTVSNLDLNDGTIGLELAYSNHNTISGNTMNNNKFAGIYIESCSDNTVKTNTIEDNGYGIDLQLATDNNIEKNKINKNSYGIFLYLSDSNTILENTMLYNGFGVYFSHPSNSNTIYHNDFIDNGLNAMDEKENINYWDNGNKGNYWGDYKEKCPDARRIWTKGIWDTPYDIPGGDSQDRYPLIKPIVSSREKTSNPISTNFLEKMLDCSPRLVRLLQFFQSLTNY